MKQDEFNDQLISCNERVFVFSSWIICSQGSKTSVDTMDTITGRTSRSQRRRGGAVVGGWGRGSVSARFEPPVHFLFRLNRFNKAYVKRWLIAGERSTEPQLISFYNKMEMKQAMMLVESGSAAKLPALVSVQNVPPRAPSRQRAMPSISKSREQEIRKLLRANLQNTRQRLRSYSRHDLMIDPLEDNVSEVRFRRQRVEMERRVSLHGNMSHYLTVPANRQETPPVRKVCFEPEHQVYTYDDSDSPRGRSSQPQARPPDAISLLNESQRRSNQSSTPQAAGDQDQDQDQVKLSRCLSDPGPNQEGGEQE
ncbi:hypothetical protein INR49_010742 [Caranx melampygus]|nr:hypothetical protein INR49_010742 [Caranx melampygus]